MFLVEQFDRDVSAKHFLDLVAFLEFCSFLPQLEEFKIFEHRPSFQGDMAILRKSWLCILTVYRAITFTVFDNFCFEIEPCHFRESHARTAPVHFKMKLRKRIFKIVRHIKSTLVELNYLHSSFGSTCCKAAVRLALQAAIPSF